MVASAAQVREGVVDLRPGEEGGCSVGRPSCLCPGAVVGFVGLRVTGALTDCSHSSVGIVGLVGLGGAPTESRPVDCNGFEGTWPLALSRKVSIDIRAVLQSGSKEQRAVNRKCNTRNGVDCGRKKVVSTVLLCAAGVGGKVLC